MHNNNNNNPIQKSYHVITFWSVVAVPAAAFYALVLYYTIYSLASRRYYLSLPLSLSLSISLSFRFLYRRSPFRGENRIVLRLTRLLLFRPQAVKYITHDDDVRTYENTTNYFTENDFSLLMPLSLCTSRNFNTSCSLPNIIFYSSIIVMCVPRML